MWCLVCPWEAMASWIRRLAFWRRSSEPLALDARWPRWLSNVYPATIFFVGLTWLELGWGVTMSPRATAVLGLLMLVMAVVPALFFEKRAFCKYACLVGRICGLYSLLAPVEIRAKDRDVCKDCHTKDCLKGNDNGYECPTGQYLGTMDRNTYCTVCTECLKTCTTDNVALNVRTWGADLATLRKPRTDEATLALVLLSLTSFHGLTMTPTWTAIVEQLRAATGTSWLQAFSIGMVAILLVPGLLFAVSTAGAHRLGGGRRKLVLAGDGGPLKTATTYAYALIPVALMYHLAHNAGHFFAEATKLIPVVSDPFGSGQDLFGTASIAPFALVSMETTWAVMVLLVLVGHLWANRALRRLERHLISSSVGARIIVAAFVLGATAINLWLLAQPMEMRTGM